MAGRSYEETVQVLLRGLKNGESQTRAASLVTLEKVLTIAYVFKTIIIQDYF